MNSNPPPPYGNTSLMKAIESHRICEGYEPMPGYVLEELLGRGGFGEVWRANAPGGLKKAVKFVFGGQDQARATRELRSLERIKGVHHPFLLTLERFEIVDNQLVIVTELADCSLEDVYRRHRARGSCGIPRDTLLSHLHDAADALDYLHENYQLQHLDIKPGNLLLVGGHVKVADFGLLKDLAETECSLVGGLTPIYAPPEVFDGRPSLHSDQYSLAVMYQELLTGTRPFSGRTIAQLATQHVHSAPNLEPLPPGDRPLAARALEKDPTRRYANCKEFVRALVTPRSDAVTGAVPQQSAKPESPQVEDLPQLGCQSEAVSQQANHVMVVALGGTGAETLADLRSRVAEQAHQEPIDFHGVLIDTDLTTLYSMRLGEVSELTPKILGIPIPLKSANDYRKSGTDRLKTVSRRWIYNVPRSGSTEGMRPLGRLALVDHGPDVVKALRGAVERLKTRCGDRTPHVYVTGSLAGGTGSGIYLDTVHLLRSLLDHAGLEQTKILSLLAGAELRADPGAPLALHDTQAAVIEMEHFMRAANGYPGDEGAGLPSVPAARTPLHNVYLIAAPPRGGGAPLAHQTVADYLWTDATGGGALLAAARRPNESDAEGGRGHHPTIRSVGVVPLDAPGEQDYRFLIPSTIRHLLLRWLGMPADAKRDAPQLSARLIRRAGVSWESFMDSTAELIHPEPAQRDCRVTEHLRSGAIELRVGANDADEIRHFIEQRLREFESDVAIDSALDSVSGELASALHHRNVGVTTAIESLRLMIRDISAMPTTKATEATPSADSASQDKHSDREAADSPSNDTGHEPSFGSSNHRERPHSESLRSAVAEVAADRLYRLARRLETLKERLESFAVTLAQAVSQLNQESPGDTDSWLQTSVATQEHFESTLGQLHDWTASRQLTRPLSQQGSVDPAELLAELTDASVAVIDRLAETANTNQSKPRGADSTQNAAMTGTLNVGGKAPASPWESTSVTQTFAADVHPEEDRPLPMPVQEALDAVRPTLLACGGSQRLVLVVGTDEERLRFERQVREFHDSGLTVTVIPGSAPLLIHEALQIRTSSVLQLLNRLNGENARITSRLVTRTDVDWQKSAALV